MHRSNQASAKADTDSCRARRSRCGTGRLTCTETSILALFAIALLAGALSPMLRGPLPEPASYASATVDEHDTLWEIAALHPVDGLSTAETVAVIRRVNALETAVIHPGQVLRVPTRGGEALVAQR